MKDNTYILKVLFQFWTKLITIRAREHLKTLTSLSLCYPSLKLTLGRLNSYVVAFIIYTG